MPDKRHLLTAFTLIALLLLAACGKTVQPKYYLLTPVSGNIAGSVQKQLLISVGPVILPKYLDRSQIVTRRSGSELHLADGVRWAEPLQDNFSEVLAEDLRRRLQQARVTTFPAQHAANADYRVTVNVTRFDIDVRGNAVLTADWSIHDGNRASVIISKRTSYQANTSPASAYAEFVNALSDTVGQLGDDIAAAIAESPH